MANLEAIRKRISSVKSTQKITKAMKMVAGARLNRAQQRITALRPYAMTTGRVLREVMAADGGDDGEFSHPLLATREEKRSLYLVVTSDRGLCGPFNAALTKRAEREWKKADAEGREVKLDIIGRKGRDYFTRRNAPIDHFFEGAWDGLGAGTARTVARRIVAPFVAGQVDAVHLVYNEFKSAMTQIVRVEQLFPLQLPSSQEHGAEAGSEAASAASEAGSGFIFEPNRAALLERLVPMYIETTVMRALYESMASELGARMTAMDAATKNANDMISSLSLVYNRARQAAITTEILEIIGGAEALQQG